MPPARGLPQEEFLTMSMLSVDKIVRIWKSVPPELWGTFLANQPEIVYAHTQYALCFLMQWPKFSVRDTSVSTVVITLLSWCYYYFGCVYIKFNKMAESTFAG